MARLNRQRLRICCVQLSLYSLGIIATLCGAGSQKSNDAEALFEAKYKAWQEYIHQPQIAVSSWSNLRIDNGPYREIIQFGIPALPYMMDKIENDAGRGGRFLSIAVSKISKKKFHITRTGQKPSDFRWTVEEFLDMNAQSKPPARYKLWLRWWKEGPKRTPQQFEKFYQEWKKLNAEGKEIEAKEKYQRIIDLGVAALPYMIEKIEKGDKELISAVSYLTDGEVKTDAKISDCLEWWKKNKEKWTIPWGVKKK